MDLKIILSKNTQDVSPDYFSSPKSSSEKDSMLPTDWKKSAYDKVCEALEVVKGGDGEDAMTAADMLMDVKEVLRTVEEKEEEKKGNDVYADKDEVEELEKGSKKSKENPFK